MTKTCSKTQSPEKERKMWGGSEGRNEREREKKRESGRENRRKHLLEI